MKPVKKRVHRLHLKLFDSAGRAALDIRDLKVAGWKFDIEETLGGTELVLRLRPRNVAEAYSVVWHGGYARGVAMIPENIE